ncbi:AAA family ATPase [Weissella diestrammenae]|uniref:AAA family ATPase n=1 Tax=Weissella diestrammenae TaxID=1162633 RepID=A0A7G9T445_9LACO|nr:RNA polymerase recycling motor HelD [Weissella diestrammenae]MCM0583391.1 AAA family ATPase [Weissella diestrammenae]QNN74870.1 AAA family ATPase [Weissella diestrammenae]
MSKEFEVEQQRLDTVLRKIKVAQEANDKQLDRAKKGQDEVEKGWNDVRFKSSTYSGLFETAMSVRQQQQMLQERELAQNSAEHQADVLSRLQHNPYFARIDVQESGADQPEPIYIGLASFSDAPDNFLIYDWRAPISSIYYDAGLGDVIYETPDGQQSANVSLKRQFQIEDGKIVTLFDTDEAVGDQMLLNAVSGESSTKMKSIVTTIQREQNKIIRNTRAELLFVQGAAGSGKTSAVLQRVAYLLYRYRGNLSAGQVVMFSPNQLFNDYIDQVLPEMGEQNMVQMTYYQYASRRLPKLKLETLQERFEEQQPLWQQQINDFKGTSAFFNAVGTYAETLNQAGMKFRPIKFHGHEIISREQIAEIYYSYNDNYRLGQRLEATKERLLNKVRGHIGAEMQSDWVEARIENLSKEEYDSLLGDNVKEFKDEKAEYNALAKVIVQAEMTPVLKLISRTRFLNINAQFIQFLQQLPDFVSVVNYGLTPEIWQKGVAETLEQMRQKALNLADMTPFMYLFDLIKGSHGERDIRFIFIDEIQDYTPFQLAFLKYSFPKARFTMLGDLNQAIFTKENARSLHQELDQLFDSDKSEYVQLTQTYRSTQQITDFAKAILIEGATINAFERTGDLPTIEVVTNHSGMIQAVKSQVAINVADHETTAIITKTLAEAEQVYAELHSTTDVTIIRTENQRLVPGTIIVPAYLAKGLEFDAVIMWNASRETYAGDDERQLVYTIASRAMHRLTILAKNHLSTLLDVAPELYVMKTR